ncbi:MAG: glycosyltransferase [Ardenticatenaceae bacterium]|nr:glycosyltransferase [Ardenticatenaceae bacterium]
MNILLVNFNIPWQGGGTFYRALGFGRALVELGHRVTLLATSVDNSYTFEKYEDQGVRVVLSPSILKGKLRTGWDLYEAIRRYRWIMQQETFDLIHAFESRPTVILPVLGVIRKRYSPLVMDWCDLFGSGGAVEERPGYIRFFLRPIETFFERNFRTRAQGTTVINEFLRQQALALGVPAEQILRLPNGVDLASIAPVDKLEARRRLNYALNGSLIGYLGNSYPGDAKLMFAAFKKILAHDPSVKLLLIGKNKIAPQIQAGLEDNIIESGFVPEDEIKWYLGACDILWLLQRDTVTNRGRFSMKVTDYMAAGRPTIGTGVGDVGQLFDAPNSIGQMVSEHPEEIAQMTVDLLQNPNEQIKYGKFARLKAEETFSWSKITHQLMKFYEKVI